MTVIPLFEKDVIFPRKSDLPASKDVVSSSELELDVVAICCDYNEEHDGIEIQAYFSEPTHFSGEVIELDNGNFVVPFEPEYFDNIDAYFEKCSDEITEGYLLPNNLYDGGC